MNQRQEIPSLKGHKDVEVLEKENELVAWLSEHGKTVLIVSISIVLGFFLVYMVVKGRIAREEQNYINVNHSFNKLLQAAVPSAEAPLPASFQELEQFMKKHPELHTKYDGMLAQLLINWARVDLALPIASEVLARTAVDNQPYFARYAETTMSIEKQEYALALGQSEQLQQQLSHAVAESTSAQDSGLNPLLFLNLLRIGVLQQQLGKSKEELETWKQLQALIQEPYYSEISSKFKIGNTSLADYVADKLSN